MEGNGGFTRIRKIIWNILINLNIYKEDDEEDRTTPPDDNRIQMQFWSTRLFVVSFFITFIVLTMMTSIPKQLITTTIKNPTVEMYDDLQSKYGDQVQCPCSQFNTILGEYINVTVTYHQVCSSDFINEQWIERSYGANVSYIWPMDSRTIISAHAQFLRSFCNLSETLVDDALLLLFSTSLVNAKGVSLAVLTSQVNVRLDELRSSIAASLSLQLNIIHQINIGNNLISGLGTDTYISISAYDLYTQGTLSMDPYSYQLITSPSSICRCASGDTCHFPSGIYTIEQSLDYAQQSTGYIDRLPIEDNSTMLIPGLKIDCVPLESFLSSTLECYYNMSCIQVFITSDIDMKPLDPTKKTRFNIFNTTIKLLIQSLFIEEFNNTVNHKIFFVLCAPHSCSYTIMQHNHFNTIVITILSLIGGLSAILKLLCPLLIRIFVTIKNKIKRRSNSPIQSITEVSSSLPRKTYLFNMIKIKVSSLNVFKSQSRSAQSIKRQVWSTRIYILVLTTTMIILTLYSIFKESSIKITINEPSEDEYNTLYSVYNDSLECPCEEIVMNYVDIVQVQPQYHQICSSDFLSDDFFSRLNSVHGQFVSEDFIMSASSYFHLIKSICILVQTIINNSYKQFLSVEYIYQNLLPSYLFLNQTNITIDIFILNTREQFFRTFFMTREMASANQLMSAMESNYFPYINSFGSVIIRSSQEFGSLKFCGSSSDLCRTTGFYDTSGTIKWTIPGVKRCCFLIESLLQSTFECWYDMNCIAIFTNYSSMSLADPFMAPSVLNQINTRFSFNTTFNDILNELIVEQWISAINYSSFYLKCSPQSCTYTMTKRDNLMAVIKIVVGIYGGLNKSLRIFIPLIIAISFFLLPCLEIRGEINHVLIRGNICIKMINFIRSINFFQHVPNTNKYCQRIGTRIYSILFLLVIAAFLLYKITDKSTVQVVLLKPSYDNYINLYNLTKNNPSKNFECPCSTVSLSYIDFVYEISSTYHEICDSWFVRDPWVLYLALPYEYENTFALNGYWNDSRQYGQSFFRNIESLCTIVIEILPSYWKEYYTRQFISTKLLTENQFYSEMNRNVNTSQEQFISYLVNLMTLTKNIMEGNQYISAFRTNWLFYVRPDPSDGIYIIATKPLSYETNCSCSVSSKCIEQSFYINQYYNETFYVPGMYVGCLPIEGLMASTFECFYSQSCVDRLVSMFQNQFFSFPSFSALNQSSSSKYQPNTTVKKIFESLFLEEISVKMSYDKYFHKCAASSCSYTDTALNSWIDIFISLLGVYGGLVIVLRLIVPYIIKILFKISQRKTKQTNRQVKPLSSPQIEHMSSIQ